MKAEVTKLPGERWEDGDDHDARSVELINFMRDYDDKFQDGMIDLPCGGDGDFGEELMYLMDEYFAAKDKHAVL